jgi:hypothetical protein
MGVYLNDVGWSHMYKGLSGLDTTFTFACWVRPKNITETHPFVTWCINAAKYDGHTLTGRGDLANDPVQARTEAPGGGAANVSGYNGLVANSWQHVAGIFKPDYALVYLDGNAGTPATASITDPTGMDLFQIGYYEFHTAHSAEMDVAEVSVWEAELTSDQISVLAGGKTALYYPTDLTVYHKLIDDYTCTQGSGTLTTYGTPSISESNHPTIDYDVLTTPDVVWGHVTGVTEDSVQTWLNNWTGTGLIVGSGDSEKIALSAGENLVSEVVDTGVKTIELEDNVYNTGDTPTIEYRHGATQVACEAASWNSYSAPFLSLGYVQIRLTP